MPARPIIVPEDVPVELVEGFEKLMTEVGVTDDFPDEVEQAAEQACSASLPLSPPDLTAIEFFAIDPPGAKDIDQIMHLSRDGDGYLVRYGIACVSAFVEPGGPVDVESHRRGQTYYAPHRRFPLYPPVLSESAASLLAGQTRPAFVWHIRLDAAGEVVDVDLGRAMVRSREQLTYDDAQARIDDGSASESLMLLREIGEKRLKIETERGGVSLNLPAQEVEVVDGQWTLIFRAALPVEDWNAQISLLTGICAAKLLLRAKVGIVRTLPAADERALRRLRRVARAMGVPWPDDMGYPDFVRSLDPETPKGVAMMYACTSLFRGAGYLSFDGTVPKDNEHAALATPYAHTTAPLRRLVDRYVLECCAAIVAGEEVPGWVREALPELPEQMTEADRRAKRFERGIVDLVEVLVLHDRIGQSFRGTIVDVDDQDGDRGSLLLEDPAVEARLVGKRLEAGEEVDATLESANMVTGKVEFRS